MRYDGRIEMTTEALIGFGMLAVTLFIIGAIYAAI